jgi:peptidoglycan/LPS O-acetylase OafA/YrhL
MFSAPQLKRDPLGSMDEFEQRQRDIERRYYLGSAVVFAWLFGVVLAITSGWDPGPWWDTAQRGPWPYPLTAVLGEIAKITVICFALYDLLRPQTDVSSFSRVARAVGALGVAWILAVMFSWTDRPGYAYVTSTYLYVLTSVLLVVLVVYATTKAFRAIKNGNDRGHAA